VAAACLPRRRASLYTQGVHTLAQSYLAVMMCGAQLAVGAKSDWSVGCHIRDNAPDVCTIRPLQHVRKLWSVSTPCICNEWAALRSP
jgi:hypothetical protein